MAKTAMKALAVLERLAANPEPSGVSELARALGLMKSNVHRLLNTLVEAGYARRRPEGSYEATLRLWEMGVRVLNRLDLRRVAHAHLVRLARDSDETVHLTILDRGEVVYVDKIESSHPVREFTRVGDRAPAHCTATGKVLLAFADPMPAPGALKTFTRNTITDPRRLQAELQRARRQGFAFNLGEYGREVNGIAAPVADHSGRIVAAIAISGPAERMRQASLRRLTPHAIATARRISAELGFRGALPGWAGREER